jgi:signal transduction histidine kinase/GAF domain-containing protein
MWRLPRLLIRGPTRRNWWQRYAAGVLCPLAAIGLRLALDPVLGKRAPFLVFFSAITVASWYGGIGPAVVAGVIASAGAAFFFLPPYNQFGLAKNHEIAQVVVFLIEGAVVGWLSETRLRALIALDRAAGEQQSILEREQAARSAAEAAQYSMAFLAEAGTVLASSLEYETTLASVARLAVPQIADWCAVHVVEENGAVQQLAAAHVDPAKVQLARDLEQKYPYDPDAPMGVPAVLRSGQPEIVPEIPEELIEASVPDPDDLEIIRHLGLRSSMIVPLVARGRILGAMTFVSAESGRRFGEEDLALAQELAARAALAVDNARLYREAHRTAAERAAILGQMADGVAIADAEGTVKFVNEAGHRITGGIRTTDKPAAWYVEPYELLTLDGRPYTADELPLTRAIRDREAVTDAGWQIRRADGSRAVVEGTAVPVFGPDGELLGAVSTFRDVTAQRSLERQKDEFLSAAAHDLRTPLTTIKGLAQLLQRRIQRMDLPEGQRLIDGLEQMDGAVKRMTRLIDQLLDTTRLQMGRPIDLTRRPVNLVTLAHEVTEEFRHGSDGHRILLETSTAELTVAGDADRLERVLLNLLSNAVKYSPNGGDVVVTVEQESGDGESMALIAVRDHGLGIPAADLPHIFERFYRGANVDGRIPGTGIGLAGAKQIVEEHGGTIAAESREDEGTTMTIRLPMHTAGTSPARETTRVESG